jgi:hypothetical protein
MMVYGVCALIQLIKIFDFWKHYKNSKVESTREKTDVKEDFKFTVDENQ